MSTHHKNHNLSKSKSKSEVMLDQEFNNIFVKIQKLIHNHSKHDKIRITLWIKKLAAKIDNIVWRQNRNFYLRVLYEMILQNMILEPFNKTPPQGPLPWLTAYNIPYPIRKNFLNEAERQFNLGTCNKSSQLMKLNNEEVFHRSTQLNKQNILNQNISYDTENQKGLCSRIKAHRKNNSFVYQQLNSTVNSKKVSFNEGFKQISNLSSKSSISNQTIDIQNLKNSNLSKTLFKDSLEQNMSKNYSEQLNQSKMFGLLKRSLKFLAKNYQLLEDQIEYKNLISQIIKVGDQRNIDLRNIDIEPSVSPRKLVFKKYSDRIKQQFNKTDEESKQFMEYLSIIKNK